MDVKAKTVELAALERRYRPLASDGLANAEMDTNPLSMALNGAVDTGLAGGIPLYRRAFFDSAFVTANADKIEMIDDLRKAIDEQVKTSKHEILLFTYAFYSCSDVLVDSCKLPATSREAVSTRHGWLPRHAHQVYVNCCSSKNHIP